MWGGFIYFFIYYYYYYFNVFRKSKFFWGGIVDKITLAKLEPLIIYAREHLNPSVDYR